MTSICKRSSVHPISKQHTGVADIHQFGDFNTTQTGRIPVFYPTSGAYHGVKFNMIFGASADTTGIAESDAQRQLQDQMRSAWGSFIADPQRGLEALGWPIYNPEGDFARV